MGEDNAAPNRNPAEEAREDISEMAAKALSDENTLPDENASPDEPTGEDTGTPAGWGADVDWSPGDAPSERTPGDPSVGRS